MNSHVEKTTDFQRANYEAEREAIAARRSVIAAEVALLEVKDELTDTDAKAFDAMKELDARLKGQDEVYIKHLTKMDMGSRDDARRDFEVVAEAFDQFLLGGARAVNDSNLVSMDGDFLMAYSDEDVARAFAPEAVNNISVRPSDGWSAQGLTEVLRQLKSRVGMRDVCYSYTTPTGNEQRIPNINSLLEGRVIAEDATAPPTPANIQPTLVKMLRQTYSSLQATIALPTSRDAQFNFDREIAITLGQEIAAVQNHDWTGDKARPTIGGVATSTSKSLRSTVQTHATGTGTSGAAARRFSGNTANQLLERLDVLYDALDPQYYQRGPAFDPRGSTPPGYSVYLMMHHTLFRFLNRAFSADDKTLVARTGATFASGGPIWEIEGIPVAVNTNFASLPTGTNRDFAANDFIAALGNFTYAAIRDIGTIRFHEDPYGNPGQNNQKTLIAFAEGYFNCRGGLNSSDECEAIQMLLAGAS